MSPMEPIDPRKQAELERLMTAAYVYRRRGDYTLADHTIRKAIDIDPASLEVREFAADLLFARGELEKAAEEYKRIFEQDKTRASAEQKYATAVLQLSEGKRQQQLLQEVLESPNQFRVPPRNPAYAALLSLAPGFGHAYCGQLVKGIILFLATMLCWLLFYAFSPDMTYYAELGDRAKETMTPTNYFFKNLSVPALFFACAAFALHIYALIDGPVLAGKLREQQRGTSTESG